MGSLIIPRRRTEGLVLSPRTPDTPRQNSDRIFANTPETPKGRFEMPPPGTPRTARPRADSCDSNCDIGDLNRGQDLPIMLMAPTQSKKAKHQTPQQTIDEFWEKFNSKHPGKASTVLPKDKYAEEAGEKVKKGSVEGENAVASYEEAAEICRAKVEKIVRECRRVNQKYRDPHFDIEFDLKWGKKDCLKMLDKTSGDASSSFAPGSVKRVGDIFENPQFYVGGPSANDIRQGRDGDCWFMAALCTLGNKPGLIEKVCVARDETVGVYGFVFHRDGEWRSEVIDDKLYLTKPDYDESWIERNLIEDRQRINSEEDYRKIYQTNSGALYFAQCENPNETWLPLMEKAYAKAHGDYAAIEGGFTGEGLEDLTGGVTTEIFSTDILDKEYFWKEELMKVNQDFLFGCAAGIFYGRGYRKGIYEGHAYSIMKAVEIDGQRLVLLRNPWGEGEWTGPWSDGSKEWTPEWMQKLEHRFGDDGAFWMSYDDLLKKYQTFDRTRLFSDEWKVTQQWSSLQVPWTVDYHDTKFSFTLDKPAPVVLVLSQLDSRYFCGLEGQYSFELSFRIHKAGEDDYIVRSHGNYWMRRSVTAELELPEGEYHVLMRIEAVKNKDGATVEQVVRNNAKDRRDKLLRIGLAYDLAHAKGQINADEEKKAKKLEEDRKKDKARKLMKEKMMKAKQKAKHNENKIRRKDRAAKEKRKAKAAAKKAKFEAEQKAKAEAEEKAKAEAEEKARIEAEKTAKVEAEAKAKADKEAADKELEKKSETDDTKDAKPESEKTEATVDNKATEDAAAATESEKTEATEDKKTQTTEDAPAATEVKDEAKKVADSPTASPIQGSNQYGPMSTDQMDMDDDDDSDIESVVSDISVGAIDDEIAAAELSNPDGNVPLTFGDEEEEDEFQKDPWNAIVVVGLRVYSKESNVSVKVIRPNPSKEEKRALDVDDSAADATKHTDVANPVTEGKGDEEKKGEERKEGEEVKEESKPESKEEKKGEEKKGEERKEGEESKPESKDSETQKADIKIEINSEEAKTENQIVKPEAEKMDGEKTKTEEEQTKDDKTKVEDDKSYDLVTPITPFAESSEGSEGSVVMV
ncbi:hypothetical protein B7494_g3844 [Chlorociboria aeruginascens]|nr:hypothetical protein B7494_g3844 [Chlorociboria aeruginascens]